MNQKARSAPNRFSRCFLALFSNLRLLASANNAPGARHGPCFPSWRDIPRHATSKLIEHHDAASPPKRPTGWTQGAPAAPARRACRLCAAGVPGRACEQPLAPCTARPPASTLTCAAATARCASISRCIKGACSSSILVKRVRPRRVPGRVPAMGGVAPGHRCARRQHQRMGAPQAPAQQAQARVQRRPRDIECQGAAIAAACVPAHARV